MTNQRSLTPALVKGILGGAFNRDCISSLNDSLRVLQLNRTTGDEAFLSIVRSLILDTTRTWTQKADDWTGDKRQTEEENEAFCRYIWEVVSEGQPWPLDEVKK